MCDRSCFLAAQESGEFGEILSLCTTPQEPRVRLGGRLRVERGHSPPGFTRSTEPERQQRREEGRPCRRPPASLQTFQESQ